MVSLNTKMLDNAAVVSLTKVKLIGL